VIQRIAASPQKRWCLGIHLLHRALQLRAVLWCRRANAQLQIVGPILGDVGITMSAPPDLLDIHNQERF
jgi:hypothetical protein